MCTLPGVPTRSVRYEVMRSQLYLKFSSGVAASELNCSQYGMHHKFICIFLGARAPVSGPEARSRDLRRKPAQTRH